MSKTQNKGLGRSAIVFCCCVLAMPTCVYLLSGFHSQSLGCSVAMGVLLGVAHVILRPILRFVSAPIGCLTLGLIQPIIDIGLIYGCAALIDGFEVTSFLHALLAVALVNTICFITCGRK